MTMMQHVWRLGRIIPLLAFVLTFSQGAWGQEPAVEKDAAQASASGTSLYPVSEEDLATARLHFANGVELLQTEPPNYQDAYQQFVLALDKSGRSWKVLGNLAFCALKLERDGEALAYYEEYLERGGDKIDPREKVSIERETLLARGNLATVQIESSNPEARISVMRQGSSAPVQIYRLEDGKAELGVRSGTLTISADASGKQLTWKTVLGAGETASHVFDFDAPPAVEEAPPASTTAASPPPPPPEVSKKGMSPLRLTGIITTGVGVLALGGGVVTGVLSQSKEKSAQDQCIENTCPESAESDFDAASSLAMMTNVLLITGGVLTATGITLIIVGGRGSGERVALEAPSANKPRLALSPLVAPGAGGLLAHGSF